MKKHNVSIGRMGEKMAEDFLADQGFTLAAKRFRTARGEIDLIVTKEDLVVFAEVKTRNSNRFGCASEAVTKKKQQTMAAVAQQFLIDKNWLEHPVRFDVIEVYPKENRICHISDAFFTSVC